MASMVNEADDPATPEFHDAFSIGDATSSHGEEEDSALSFRPASSVKNEEIVDEEIEEPLSKKRCYGLISEDDDPCQEPHNSPRVRKEPTQSKDEDDHYIWSRSTEGSPVIVNMPNPTERRVLVIAGSDSSGGAGIEADQRVLALHKCYALTAITALTAQNTEGVVSVMPTPPNFVAQAINTVWEDVGVDVVKIGMLSSAATVSAVARTLQAKRDRGDEFSVVLDPVMKSTSGSQLLPFKAVSVLRYELLPLATMITPNIPEALLLVSRTGGTKPPPKTREEMITLAKDVWNLARKPWVLLKGGHFAEAVDDDEHECYHAAQSAPTVVDVLYDGVEIKLLEKDFVASKNTHGTGCSLASAIAANLAIGLDLAFAVGKASSYIDRGIKGAVEWKLGKGHGPIDHWS